MRRELVEHVDRIAEIPEALRRGTGAGIRQAHARRALA